MNSNSPPAASKQSENNSQRQSYNSRQKTAHFNRQVKRASQNSDKNLDRNSKFFLFVILKVVSIYDFSCAILISAEDAVQISFMCQTATIQITFVFISMTTTKDYDSVCKRLNNSKLYALYLL